MNLKENFLTLLGNQKNNIKKYSITLLLVAVITITMIFVGFENENLWKVYVILSLATVLSFVTETILGFKIYRIPFYIISFILAYITQRLLFAEEHNVLILMAIAGAYISLFLYAIYKIIKDSELTLSQFLGRLLNNNVVLGIAIFVLQMGLVFIASIVTILLLNNSDFDIYLKLEILLFGLFIIPGELLCILNTKNEIIKPIKILICYIILPIVLIAGTIIYVYFIKILITREIPSNQIFAIISALYVCACPTWIMINNFKEENKFINKCGKIIPFVFMPFVLMQIYSLGVRVIDYGITPTRYLGIFIIVFEIISIVLTIIKEQKYLNKIIPALIIIVIISTIIPGINILEMSWNSQLNRLTSIYKDGTEYNQLSDENKVKIYGAYEYLYSAGSALNKELPEYIKSTEFNFKDEYNFLDNYIYLTHINYNGPEELNVEGYKTIKEINFYYDSFNKTQDFNNLNIPDVQIFNSKDKNNKIEAKLRNHIFESLKLKELKNDRVVIDENTAFVFTFLNCSYYSNNYNIDYLSFNGYILMK